MEVYGIVHSGVCVFECGQTVKTAGLEKVFGYGGLTLY